MARTGGEDFKMMSFADPDNLQNLLANLNIENILDFNEENKTKKLVLQLGELSARYSDLATRYLKLVNTKLNEPANQPKHENSSLINTLPKSFSDILEVN